MRTVLSFPSIIHFGLSKITTESLAKRYALMFDEVVVEPSQFPENSSWANFHEYLAIFSTRDHHSKARSIARDPRFRSIFIDRRDFLSDIDPKDMWRIALETVPSATADHLLAFFQRELFSGLPNQSMDDLDEDEIKELSEEAVAAAQYAVYIRFDVGLGFLLSDSVSGTIPSFSPLVGNALSSELDRAEAGCFDFFGKDFILPELDSLDWEDIFELRADKSARAFREMVQEAIVGGPLVNEKIRHELESDLWSLVAEVEPDVRRSAVAAIASSVPSPLIFNPVGVALSVKQIADDIRIKRRYGAVFFVQKLRSQAISKSESLR